MERSYEEIRRLDDLKTLVLESSKEKEFLSENDCFQNYQNTIFTQWFMML